MFFKWKPILYNRNKRKTLTGQPGSSQSGMSHCHLNHANLSGLCNHLWHGDVHSSVVTKSHIRVCGPQAVRSCVDICCQWYNQSLLGCPGSGPQPVTMMLSGEGACCYQGHDYLGGLHCYMRPWCHLDSDYRHGPCLHQWPATFRVWVDVLISCCHLRLIGCLGSGQPPEIMSVSEVLAATGTILIRVACAITRAMVISGSMVLWRACLGPCVC